MTILATGVKQLLALMLVCRAALQHVCANDPAHASLNFAFTFDAAAMSHLSGR